MPRFAANISMMYADRPFVERIQAAREDGFGAIECQFPYASPAPDVAAALRAQRMEMVLINTPAGDAARGERGLAAVPGAEARFRAALDEAIDYARTLGCTRIHLMAGIVPPTARPEECAAVFAANLRHAAARLAPLGMSGLVEPINPRDIPGYYLQRQEQAHVLLAAVGEPALAVQMDFYHCQIVEGDVSTRLRRYLGGVGHVQIAAVPDRGEPDQGELDYPWLFRLLDTLGYEGWVGCEYRPRGDTSAGLDWLRAWRGSGNA